MVLFFDGMILINMTITAPYLLYLLSGLFFVIAMD